MDMQDFKRDKKSNQKALKAYCEVLLMFREMHLQIPKKELSEKDAVINHIIALLIRKATDSAHPFGYSDSGKIAAQHISPNAWEQLIDKENADGLTCEHIIPISILKEYIFEHWANWECGDLEDCFQKLSATAIVTKEDDNQLKKTGVLSRMPKGCSIKKDMSEDDKLSRYRHVDIKLKSLVVATNDRDAVIDKLKKLAKTKKKNA